MAGYYTLPETTPAAPSRTRKLLKIFIFIAALCLAAELIWLFGISPLRPFSRIDISGYSGFDRAQIIAKAGITGSSSFFTTDARAVENTLMSFGTFESVRVFKHFPDRLQIHLVGREAVASAFSVINGITVPVFFDRHGVVFQIGGNVDQNYVHSALPVISGLVIENPFPGMRLPALLVPFFNDLERIGSSAPELLGTISEIRINRGPFDTFDFVLYPVHIRTRVRLSELNEELLRYALLMLDVLASREGGIEILDFRSGIASFILKEASFE